MIGYDWLGNEVDENRVVPTWKGAENGAMINIRNAPMTPQHMAFYLEDAISLEDISLRVGLRYDEFRTGWWSIEGI